MDLGRNIHQLLKHKKEVYVKGLGTFKRTHTSSVFDDQRGVYLPPVNYLEFENKSENGADFIEYVQQSNYLSRAEAESLVEEKVTEIINGLADKGSVSLNYLGQLIRHGSSLVFKPEDIASFKMTPIQGLNEFNDVDPEVSMFENDKIEVSTAESETGTNLEEVLVGNVEVDSTMEPTSEEPLYDTNTGRSSWYIWVAILSVLIIAGLFYYNYSKDNNNLDSKHVANKPVIETLVDSAARDSAKVVAFPATDTVEKKVYNPLIPENHTYQIVIGTHGTLALAYEQAESFNKAGIQSVRVIPSNLAHNKKKVIWDSYATKEEADSALRYVRKHYVSDAWHQKVSK